MIFRLNVTPQVLFLLLAIVYTSQNYGLLFLWITVVIKILWNNLYRFCLTYVGHNLTVSHRYRKKNIFALPPCCFTFYGNAALPKDNHDLILKLSETGPT
jgi:hypothetical protein